MSTFPPLSPPRTSPENIREEQSAREAAKTPRAGYATTPGLRHFWLRRIHSLAGIVFGLYIVVHLVVNFTGWWPLAYQQNVDHIHAMEPMLPLIEILFIFLPLIIHIVYGIYVASAKVDYGTTTHYSYGGNARYVLQRVTSFILLVFVIYHIGTLHKWGFSLVGLQAKPAFNPENLAYQTTAQALKAPYASAAANIAVIVFYLLGIWSATFHFANGLWTAAIAWGLTATRAAQRRWGQFCLAAGIVLTLVGTGAWAAFCIAGNPSLPESQTQTMSEARSAMVHGEATGGSQSLGEKVPPGVRPQNATEHSAPLPVPGAQRGR